MATIRASGFSGSGDPAGSSSPGGRQAQPEDMVEMRNREPKRFGYESRRFDRFIGFHRIGTMGLETQER
jgi:hypothetical protein